MLERKLVKGVEIKVFTMRECKPCDELEDALVACRIPHILTDVGVNERDRDEATRICQGFERDLTLPVLLVTRNIPGQVDSLEVFIKPQGKSGLESVTQALFAFCIPDSRFDPYYLKNYNP